MHREYSYLPAQVLPHSCTARTRRTLIFAVQIFAYFLKLLISFNSDSKSFSFNCVFLAYTFFVCTLLTHLPVSVLLIFPGGQGFFSNSGLKGFFAFFCVCVFCFELFFDLLSLGGGEMFKLRKILFLRCASRFFFSSS